MSDAVSPPAATRPERILVVTGRLAQGLARQVARQAQEQQNLEIEVAVVGISVAALLHVDWLIRKLTISETYDRVIVPGWCQGDLSRLTSHFGLPFERGPKDIHELPAYLGGKTSPPDLSLRDIEIIAEINHAPRLTIPELLHEAHHYRDSGADVIDLGCIPGERWTGIAAAVAALRSEGFKISVDTFDRWEVETAVEAGTELVLSCNSSNLDWAQHIPVEWVLIPDDPANLPSLDPIQAAMQQAGRKFRLDPILEPVGYGFAQSLARYHETRRRHPQAPMMMGIGNVTELSEVDSAGINFLLAAICQELRIHSVLTTEVINWCRTAVAEFDRAARLARYAIEQRALPKHAGGDLLLLRDPPPPELGPEVLAQLAREIRDPNFRIFVERGEIHVLNRDGYWHGQDPFELFDSFSADARLDPSHAFYLGYELSKAVTALTLGKGYRQDEALRWGFLTIPEISPHERRRQPAVEDPQ